MVVNGMTHLSLSLSLSSFWNFFAVVLEKRNKFLYHESLTWLPFLGTFKISRVTFIFIYSIYCICARCGVKNEHRKEAILEVENSL